MSLGLDLFEHPFSCVVNGPSGCGKTEWIKKLLYSDIIQNIPKRIVWCYGRWQNAYHDLQGMVEFREGLNGINEYKDTLLILDDLMMDTDKHVMDLFVRGRHKNLSVIFVTHNVFYKTPALRTIRLNTNYLVLFKTPCDTSQIIALGRQMFPGQSKHWEEAYKDATKKIYGYLLIDNRPNTEDIYRLRTQIFPNEEQIVYVPK